MAAPKSMNQRTCSGVEGGVDPVDAFDKVVLAFAQLRVGARLNDGSKEQLRLRPGLHSTGIVTNTQATRRGTRTNLNSLGEFRIAAKGEVSRV